MKYAWIHEHCDSFPVAILCDTLAVSTSGYYESLTRKPGLRAERHQRIQQAVQQVHAESHGTYGSIKIARVREALQRVGADVLYLPPYSPDFNPIEQAFSKLKRLLRSAAPRTVDALWQACGAELSKFTTTEFHNDLAHCGYRYS